jgi:hypothetical protein
MCLKSDATDDRVGNAGFRQHPGERDESSALCRLHFASQRVPKLVELKSDLETAHHTRIILLRVIAPV